MLNTVGSTPSSPYNYNRDGITKLLNPIAIKDYSIRLAETVKYVLHNNKFPIVLGGDCSIVIGNVLALRHLGRYGLFFIDGHADFYQPEESPTGEVADMDLAIVSGYGPDRDKTQSAQYGCQDIKNTTIMNTIELTDVQRLGLKNAASSAIEKFLKK